MGGHPCITNIKEFDVLFAPTSPHFSDRIREVEQGRMDLLEAQRLNAMEGYQLGELTHSAMKGWAVRNVQESLGGPGWHTPFAQSREIAVLAAEAWYREDPRRREVICRKTGG